MASSININQNNNDITLQDNNRSISITDNNAGTTVNVTQPITNVVTVATPGPQGPQGPAGIPITSGSFTGSFSGSFIGNLTGTASNAISASYALTASYALSAPTVGSLQKVYYVSEEGSDSNTGKTLETAFRTIKAATIAASASISTQPPSPAYRISINVKTGYYTEIAPITVPNNVSIIGDDLRSVVVSPTSATTGSNLFLMNNGSYAYGLRLEGCTIDNLEDPRNGFFFAFAPSASISTSPYIQNCSCIYTPFSKFYVPIDSGSNPPNPLVGNGPGGMIVDDSVLSGYSPLRSMVTDSYTQVAFNGIGICLRGRGYAQLVSFFTNFSRYGVYAKDGGQASLLNSNTTFGDYGLYSSGSRILINPNLSNISQSVDTAGSSLIRSNKNNIRNYMFSKLQVSGSYNTTYLPTGSNYQSTSTDSGLLIDCLSDDLLGSGSVRISQFTSGLFKAQDTSPGKIYTLPPPSGSTFTKGAITIIPLISNSSGSLAGDFILSYQYIREYIVNDPQSLFTTLTPAGRTKVSQSISTLIDTVQRVVIDNAGADLYEEFGSLITATSQDFSYVGSGVNFLALPNNQGGVGQAKVENRIIQVSGGRVFFTGGDELGDFNVGTDFVIKQATGTIEGRTFFRALSSQITPVSLALET